MIRILICKICGSKLKYDNFIYCEKCKKNKRGKSYIKDERCKFCDGRLINEQYLICSDCEKVWMFEDYEKQIEKNEILAEKVEDKEIDFLKIYDKFTDFFIDLQNANTEFIREEVIKEKLDKIILILTELNE